MKKSIAIVQTSAVSSGELKTLCSEILPGVTVYQIIDDSLIREINGNGGPTYGVRRRLYQYYQQAESLGVDVILNQCSSVGEVADEIRPFIRVPIVKIDEAMAEKAVTLGRQTDCGSGHGAHHGGAQCPTTGAEGAGGKPGD